MRMRACGTVLCVCCCWAIKCIQCFLPGGAMLGPGGSGANNALGREACNTLAVVERGQENAAPGGLERWAVLDEVPTQAMQCAGAMQCAVC